MTDNFFLDVLFLYIYKDVLMGCFSRRGFLMKLAKSFIPFVVLSALMLVACGDDGSTNASGLPDDDQQASMGFARWNGDINSFKDCVMHADKKMYEDKRAS